MFRWNQCGGRDQRRSAGVRFSVLISDTVPVLSETYMPFVDDKGLLNEFAMMYALRERFPLHYVVFRQTSSHLPHEANVEQVFSRSGLVGPEHAA